MTAQADAVANVLANIGLPATEVVPVLAFAGKRRWTVQLGPVTVLGERHLPVYLTRRGMRLDAGQVTTVVEALDEMFDPNRGTAVAVPLRTRTPRASTAAYRSAVQTNAAMTNRNTERSSLRRRLSTRCGKPPVRSRSSPGWRGCTRPRPSSSPTSSIHSFSIRGAAGTGKTCVALHRAKYLAFGAERVLVTSFVRTLPKVQKQIYRRLAPDADLVRDTWSSQASMPGP